MPDVGASVLMGEVFEKLWGVPPKPPLPPPPPLWETLPGELDIIHMQYSIGVVTSTSNNHLNTYKSSVKGVFGVSQKSKYCYQITIIITGTYPGKMRTETWNSFFLKKYKYLSFVYITPSLNFNFSDFFLQCKTS